MAHHWFSCPVVIGEFFFFVLSGWSIIFKLHIPSKKVYIECLLPLEVSMLGETDYVSLVKNDKKIILFPHLGFMIVEYDLESHTFEMIDISDKINKFGNGPLYNYVYKYKNRIIAQGLQTTTLISYDIKNGKYSYIDISQSYYSKYGRELEKDSFTAGVIVGNNIYIALKEKNQLLKINIDDWEVELITIGHDGENWNSVALHNDKIYLSSAYKLELVEYSIKDKSVNYLQLYQNVDWLPGQNKRGWAFSKILLVNNLLRCFPFYADSLVEIDLESGMISSFKYSLGMDGTFCEAYYDSGKIWSFVRQVDEDYILLFNEESKERIRINFSTDISNTLYRLYMEAKKIPYESCLYNINHFIESV
ncbi:hypothetical protein [Schwartzia succinivorans]|jgi:hypothetical protein|uniref:Uncharacterized protein n=1 Tax=Schwartzia succinivorans DSM 10502 TaxID=1123243 RepID=A0A1M4SM11_9FIRM|nr:hypothetical protein [Schwartzia succinivorans]SHE33260.1 hypothetical protein SAMN02745190_00182 [Schwartzia succinivorans DSM 10502]